MKIIIIGNGISGITAARFIRKLSDYEITVLSYETDFFFSRTALMYIYMGHMRYEDTKPYEDWFWDKNKINLKNARVEHVDFTKKALTLSSGEKMSYDKLIIGTGSASNKFGWPGQDLERVYGMYSYQDLEAMEKYSEGLKRAVIVGGGLIGIEMAEMFHSRHIPVTLLVREEHYWNNVLPLEESKMVSRHIREHGLDLRLETELKEIHDNGKGEANAVTTNKGEKIECGFVGLTAGVHPNVQFLKKTDLEIDKGIVVNEFLETNMQDVYAIGDCAQLKSPKEGRRSIEAIWYTGKMMGETVAYNVCDRPVKYDPGIWFNSAKFLDIEYMVYGEVPTKIPDTMGTLYWEHPDGRKSIRINYDKNHGHVLGFNLMGVRYRHEVCEKWIKEKTNIENVLQHLGLANFDPEFYKQYDRKVVELYNEQTGKNLELKTKRGLAKVLSFLNR
ncbi:NAD(P)/FAD-dependent oxidoreductase [Portibacter marinus]|uniref:NAD(P)/FAD-dependent oxidoreductase n=1 Tax=Portibacter marinus TaxID=2898660 RepID=UPI001F161E19|nr:FAD/NAD(P)-binding oxidoreductase [Portibacter marinus]